MNILILLIGIAVVVIVAAQNAAPVVVSFLFWKLETSLSVVIFLAVFSGALLTAVFIFSSQIRRYFKTRRSGPRAVKDGPGNGGDANGVRQKMRDQKGE